jgi:hypothetical protein
MSDLYRDPLVHVRSRIAELVSRIDELEARVPDSYWQAHPDELARAEVFERRVMTLTRDSALDSRAPPDASSAPPNPQLLELEHALADAAKNLEDVLARVPGYRAELAMIPPGRPPAQPNVSDVRNAIFGDNEATVEWTLQRLTGTMRAIDEHAEVTSDGMLKGHRIVVVAFDSGGVPFTYTGALTAPVGEYPMLGSSLATFTARDLPPLSVHPQTMLSGIGRVLGLAGNASTGDDEFDGMFRVTGEPRALVRLSRLARSALVEIAGCDVPRLEVEQGLARATWSYELTVGTFDRLVRAAIRCLREVRGERENRSSRPTLDPLDP